MWALPLEELARLDIAAMHLEDHADPAQNTLHVIGRTYSEPHKYFHRRYAHEMWTPWEPVTSEIEGDHLAPVVWRDRLHLFWATFAERTKPEAKPGAGPPDASGNERPVSYLTMAEVVGTVTAVSAKKLVDVQLH